MPAMQTILIVEDEPLLLDHVGEVLSDVGYRVLLAANAAEALHYLADRTCPIDLLFTDIRMPGGLNGLALAQAAREGRPGVPVLLTTGFASELLAHPAPPAWALLRKPYTPDQLLTTIRTVLAQAAAGLPQHQEGPHACD
jgi:DNA-binding NtrC family response regulator